MADDSKKETTKCSETADDSAEILLEEEDDDFKDESIKDDSTKYDHPNTTTSESSTSKKESNMADLFRNPEARKILSYLIAKLEINYKDCRQTMFRTLWARKNFYEGLKNLKHNLTSEQFNIDKWYKLILQDQSTGTSARYIDGTDLAFSNPDIEIDWIKPLVEAEESVPGFINLLYSMLCIEDDSHSNVSKISKHNRFDSGPQPIQSIGLLTYR